MLSIEYGGCTRQGAVCPDGDQFNPTSGSVWEDVRAGNGGIQKRLLECPPGYSLERDEAVAVTDACLPCDIGKYRLVI
jgi:hypothetical protein